MLTFDECRRLAACWVDITSRGSAVIVDDATLVKSYGWVFFYQSRAFLETGDFGDVLAGNSPLIVDRFEGELRVTGTDRPIVEYLAAYEATHRRFASGEAENTVRIFASDIRRVTTNALAIVLCGIAALNSQSCASHSGHASSAAGSVPDLAAEHDTLRCPSLAAIPSDWRTVIDETGTYELRMPPTFGAAASGKYVFIHGGQAWESGDAIISLSFGHWAEYSFEEQPGQRCRVTIGDANVFVILAPSAVVAWYDRESGSHEPVVTVLSKNQTEFRMLAPSALSLRRRVKP